MISCDNEVEMSTPAVTAVNRSVTSDENPPPVRTAAAVGSPERQQENPRDRSLSFLSREWVKSLPFGLRPQSLCKQYPRIVNRLSLCWPDLELRRRMFEDLLVDKRGGRQGFPPKVKEELVALSKYDDATTRPMGLTEPGQAA